MRQDMESPNSAAAGYLNSVESLASLGLFLICKTGWRVGRFTADSLKVIKNFNTGNTGNHRFPVEVK